VQQTASTRQETRERRLYAYIDESERNIDGDTWYLMCAATAYRDDPAHNLAMKRLAAIAQRQPTDDRLNRHAIHSSAMGGSREDDVIEAEQVIAADISLNLDIVVRRVTRQGFEETRQICVAHLMTHLDADVQSVTFDTRDYLETKTRKPKPGVDAATHRQLVNHHDLETIERLKTAGRVKADLDIVWANDVGNPHLWIPDVVAYACGQALVSGNPQRLVRLASRLHISEAVTRPDSVEPAPSTGIADRLETLRRQALPRQ